MNKSTNTMAKVLFFLLLAVAGTAKAQDYQSFFAADSTRLNVYVEMIDFCHTYYLTIHSADTVNINGTQYVKGLPHGKYGVMYEYEDFYFTEDPTTGRLYRYNPVLDDKVLICDMSLSVGDNFYYTDEYGDSYASVYNVTYEDGKKVIHLTDCYIDNVSVQEHTRQQVKVCLYPNPAQENVSIKGIEAVEVQVYNALGQVVKTVQGTNEIDLSGLVDGVYLLRIMDADGKSHAVRVMVK